MLARYAAVSATLVRSHGGLSGRETAGTRRTVRWRSLRMGTKLQEWNGVCRTVRFGCESDEEESDRAHAQCFEHMAEPKNYNSALYFRICVSY